MTTVVLTTVKLAVLRYSEAPKSPHSQIFTVQVVLLPNVAPPSEFIYDTNVADLYLVTYNDHGSGKDYRMCRPALRITTVEGR